MATLCHMFLLLFEHLHIAEVTCYALIIHRVSHGLCKCSNGSKNTVVNYFPV